MSHDLLMPLGIALCFFVAGWVKGVLGMGLPTLAMGLLGLVMTGAEAASLLILPSLVTNVWQMIAGPGVKRITRRLFTMQLGVFLGTFIGIHLLVGNFASLSSGALGGILMIYAVAGLRSVRFMVKPASETWLSPLTGVVTGVLSGATGVFVVPAVPYIASLGFEKEDLIQALGLSFTVSTAALGIALATQGVFTGQAAGGSLLALIPALAGMFVGQALRARLQAETFRKWFLASLAAIGLYMVVRSLLHASG